MSKKKNQLVSGSFRVQVLDYTDADGKRHYQSFTANSRVEAKAKANEWKYHRRELKERISVLTAVEKYIDLKRPVLSPATIKGYCSMYKNLQQYPFSRIELRDLDNAALQSFVSRLSIGHTVKYVKNYFGLISAALSIYAPDFVPHVRFPASKHSAHYTPNSDDIQALLNHCKTTEAKLGILFGAVGFMRRGEACAVTFEDVNYRTKTIAITKSMVNNVDNLWEIKEPKTYESYRTVIMPDYVFSLIHSLDRKQGRILNMDPSQLYKAFRYALRHAGLPSFRYHDLRHHAASYAHSIGISDRYTEAMGGWKPNSTVLKRVYENVIDLEMVKAQQKFLEKQQYTV